MSDRVVAVTGATGRQGGAVARHLLDRGWRVRALTRKPGSAAARALAALGTEVIAADMADPRDLLRAFEGVHGVFNVQNPMISGLDAEVVQGKNVMEAAKETGAQHVIFGSAGPGTAATGVGSWDTKLVIEAHARALGIPLTVLRPMAFMELMTDRDFVPQVSTWQLMPKLAGEGTVLPWIAVDDLGAIAAGAFDEPGTFIGAQVRLASELRSIGECREIWTEVTGRAPRRLPMPVWMFERFVGTDLTTMWRWLRTATLDVDPDQTRRMRPAALSVREWIVRRQRT